jgi:integrative and conjugative element protein (TIGR02256 family)
MPPLSPDLMSTGTAWISGAVVRSIQSEATTRAPDETGGVLLGYWSNSPVAPVITQALGPGPNAQHARKSFVPDQEFHESEIARLWRSNRHLQYLGDWHSHPNAPGSLSDADIQTLRRIAASRLARAPRPLMLILAEGPPWNPVLWSLCRIGKLLFRRYQVERWDLRAF